MLCMQFYPCHLIDVVSWGRAGAAGAADMIEDAEDTGVDTWATVQAALLSAIPFGSASICMLVKQSNCCHNAENADGAA